MLYTMEECVNVNKKRLKNLVLLSTIMGMVVGGNVAYAGISGSFANDADVLKHIMMGIKRFLVIML